MRGLSETAVALAGMIALALVPPVAGALGDAFFAQVMTRVMIFAIAAVSLNFILGFAGLASFGHAAFIGLGAYVVGILLDAGIANGWLHLAALLALGSLAALVIGAVCLRTSGLHFIMITLAFAQFLYFVGVGLKPYGGDDGFAFRGHSSFGAALDLGDAVTFYYLVWAVLAAVLYLVRRIVDSRFGMALYAARSNERRARSLGLPVYRYRLAAFVISGAIATVAGGLLANLTQFVSPAFMHWTRSGELLIMVIMGGLSTVFGPVLGATLYLLLEEGLAGLTDHWPAILGPILVLIVLFGRAGIAGWLVPRRRARHA